MLGLGLSELRPQPVLTANKVIFYKFVGRVQEDGGTVENPKCLTDELEIINLTL